MDASRNDTPGIVIVWRCIDVFLAIEAAEGFSRASILKSKEDG